ncbi:hypothetical protein PR048_027353 [Dryococelus australis]|uniref:Uncharacterized protein n=1 Tax=Dryococelus australis TaxID=614101 RepID=A0ABQ9GGL8_9NEOP|nr:hypothetical protein PR048_027353 [Dryococelus australis]
MEVVGKFRVGRKGIVGRSAGDTRQPCCYVTIKMAVTPPPHLCTRSGSTEVYPRFLAVQRHDGNTARLARRSDEALDVHVSVARIAPSLPDLERKRAFMHQVDTLSASCRVTYHCWYTNVATAGRPGMYQEDYYEYFQYNIVTLKLSTLRCTLAGTFCVVLGGCAHSPYFYRLVYWVAVDDDALASMAIRVCLIPGKVIPEFSQVGIVPSDFVGGRVFSGISNFLCTCSPKLPHIRFISFLSSLKSLDFTCLRNPSVLQIYQFVYLSDNRLNLKFPAENQKLYCLPRREFYSPACHTFNAQDTRVSPCYDTVKADNPSQQQRGHAKPRNARARETGLRLAIIPGVTGPGTEPGSSR